VTRKIKLSAKGKAQEKMLLEFMKMTPQEQEKAYRAQQERLRNLLGRDFNIVWPDEFGGN
jgi:hypothetical protein